MAATTPNPCCVAFQARYLKSEEKRNALRQGLRILTDQYSKLQAEYDSLKKAFDEEKSARACLEKDLKQKACEATSKQDICVQCQNKDEELTTLHSKYREREAEIDMIQMLLAEEKRSADVERENAKIEKQRALAIKDALEAEKTRVADLEVRQKSDMDDLMVSKYKKLAEENDKKVNEERSYANNLLTQLEEEMVKVERLVNENKKLRSSNDSAQSSFVAQLSAKESEVERLNILLMEQKMRVDSEQKKASELMASLESERGKERRLADAENAHAVSLKRLSEASEKKIAEEKSNSNRLKTQLTEEKQKAEKLEKQLQELLSSRSDKSLNSEGRTLSGNSEPYKNLASEKKKLDREMNCLKADAANADVQRKLAEEYGKKASEETCRADNLAQDLEKSIQCIQGLEQELSRIRSCKVLVGPSVSSDAGRDTPALKLKLLRKQLKLERKQVKLAKDVAKFEADKNLMLQQELARLKHTVSSISQHLDMLNSASFSSTQALNGLEKTGGLMNFQGQCLPCSGSIMSGSSAGNVSDCVNTTLPISNQENCTEITPGIKTILHPLMGGSQREISPSYVMNFSEASSSDKQLLGSQEPVAGSLSTSTIIADENPKPLQTASRLLSKSGKRNYAEYLASAVENADCPFIDSPSGKQKKNFDEPDYIQFDARMLNHLMESALTEFSKRISRLLEEKGHLVPGQKGALFTCNGSHKRRKTFHHEPVEATEKSLVAGEQMQGGNISAPPPCVRLAGHQAYKDGIASSVTNPDIFAFEQLVSRGYRKLLDLDNKADEELYRMAIDRPLSPTLPDLYGDNCRVAVDSPRCHVKGDWRSMSTCKNPNPRSVHNLTSFSSLGKNGSILVNKESKESHSHGGGFSAQGINDAVKSSNAPKSSTELGDSTKFLGGAECAPPFCIVFSHVKDVSSITRMFSASRTYSIHCHSLEDWVVMDLLTCIASEEELNPREKLCVFFSLILQNCFHIILDKSGDKVDQELLPSLPKHLCSALCETENGQQVLAKFIDPSDLLSLFEDFVSHRRLLVPCKMGCATVPGEDFRFDIILDGEKTGLCYKTALSDQVVAASIIFSSICLAVGQISMLWEASFGILALWQVEPQLVLRMLHVFAHVGEVKHFSSRNITSLIAVVIKSLLRHFGGFFKVGCTDAHLLGNSYKCIEYCSCLGNFQPLDVALLLVGEIKRCASEIMHLAASNSDDTLNSCISRSYSCMPIDATDHPESEDVCYVTDVMSLVELISTIMGWEWTATKILPDLLKLLESCIPGSFCTSLIFLVGRLGRYEVEKVGYKGSGAESICQCLLSLLGRVSPSESNHDVHVATTLCALHWFSTYRRNETDEFIQTSNGTFCSAAKHVASLTSEQRLLLSSGFQYPFSY